MLPTGRIVELTDLRPVRDELAVIWNTRGAADIAKSKPSRRGRWARPLLA